MGSGGPGKLCLARGSWLRHTIEGMREEDMLSRIGARTRFEPSYLALYRSGELEHRAEQAVKMFDTRHSITPRLRIQQLRFN